MYIPRSVPTFSECRFDTKPLEVGWPTYTIAHYADSDAFDAFAGEDLTPLQHSKYARASSWASRLRPVQSDFQYKYCQLQVSDSTYWNIQRVGPFTSTGNYDWWQMSGHDVFNLSHVVKNAKIFIVESFVGAVDLSGNAIPYPPVHLHHVHVNPTSGPALRYALSSYCSLLDGCNVQNYQGNHVLERHGEWGWLDHPIATEADPPGYGRLIDFPVVVDAEVNDARPPHSPSMTWFFEHAALWRPETPELKPLSHINVLNPQAKVTQHQSTWEKYFWVDASEKTLSWFSGALPVGPGNVVFIKSHVHMNLFVKGFLFASTLSDIGLYIPELRQVMSTTGENQVYQLPLSKSPFSTFNSVEDHMMSTVSNAPMCVFSPNHFINSRGDCYDRAPDTNCTPWRFQPGDHFTSVNFLEYNTGDICNLEPWLTERPSLLPMHTELFIYYEDDLPRSCYSQINVVSVSKTILLAMLCTTSSLGPPGDSKHIEVPAHTYAAFGIILAATTAILLRRTRSASTTIHL